MTSTEVIGTLLASHSPDDLRKGLELAREDIASVKTGAVQECAEVVATLFYIDPLDHPELVPYIDEAVDLVAGLGEPVIPLLLDLVDSTDVKAQLACAHALGRIGAKAVEPLLVQYAASPDPNRRAFILYALSKIDSPEVARALPLALEAALAPDTELRDTATRALGKFAGTIPPRQLVDPLRRACFITLRQDLSTLTPVIRAKAIRSLGKFAKWGHLNAQERGELRSICNALLGRDDRQEWDRAYIVRKEAEEALGFC